MRRSLVAAGVLFVLIGLAFVCPQIANLRESGSLLTGEIVLLGLGIVLSAAGITSAFVAAMRIRTAS